MLCTLYRLGPTHYGEAYRIQKRLWTRKVQGEATDALLLLEHPPTFTMGNSGRLENLLVPKDDLQKEGILLFFTDRGGDVTYHGPGQLVVYPIIDLRRRGKSIRRYIHDLEEVAIRTLADLSIAAERRAGYIGVWVENSEIAAIGVSVRKWVTMHGLTLNVNPDLRYFSLIHPCGIPGKTVTSISKLMRCDIQAESVIQSLVAHFAQVFDAYVEEGSIDSLRR